MKEAAFDQDLYEELMEDKGCQYDPELYGEIAEYYLQS